jgi:hypothetical protein
MFAVERFGIDKVEDRSTGDCREGIESERSGGINWKNTTRFYIIRWLKCGRSCLDNRGVSPHLKGHPEDKLLVKERKGYTALRHLFSKNH